MPSEQSIAEAAATNGNAAVAGAGERREGAAVAGSVATRRSVAVAGSAAVSDSAAVAGSAGTAMSVAVAGSAATIASAAVFGSVATAVGVAVAGSALTLACVALRRAASPASPAWTASSASAASAASGCAARSVGSASVAPATRGARWIAQMSEPLRVVDCGVVPYEEARALQQRVAAARQRGEVPDTLLLLEHPPVYTRGRRSDPAELPMGASWYEAQGIEVRDTDRGGRVTYHGPGQLVAYPIVSLQPLGDDVHAFVRALERVMIASLAEWRIEAGTIEGLTGVWVDRAARRARSGRSARSGSTSAAASPPTDWRSTSTTTCSRSSGSSPAGSTIAG